MTERADTIATVLLAVAAVGIAWGSYQGNRWNAEQKIASGHTNALRIDAARAQGLAEAQTEIDVATFTQWLDAQAHGERELARFYFRRFREEFKPAVVAWLRTEPFTSPRAPLSPFALPQYKLASRAEADRLDAEADASSAEAREDIERQSDYLIGVVFLAISLFFLGMSLKQANPRIKVVMLVVGCIFFVSTLAWYATLPVSVTV